MAWRAMETCPHRLEAGFIIMQRWRIEKQPVTQEVYALAAAVTNRTPRPEDIMVQPQIWEWGYDDELAVVAFQTGHHDVARTSSIRCILRGPPEIRENAIKNAHVAEAAASKNAH